MKSANLSAAVSKAAAAGLLGGSKSARAARWQAITAQAQEQQDASGTNRASVQELRARPRQESVTAKAQDLEHKSRQSLMMSGARANAASVAKPTRQSTTAAIRQFEEVARKQSVSPTPQLARGSITRQSPKEQRAIAARRASALAEGAALAAIADPSKSVSAQEKLDALEAEMVLLDAEGEDLAKESAWDGNGTLGDKRPGALLHAAADAPASAAAIMQRASVLEEQGKVLEVICAASKPRTCAWPSHRVCVPVASSPQAAELVTKAMHVEQKERKEKKGRLGSDDVSETAEQSSQPRVKREADAEAHEDSPSKGKHGYHLKEAGEIAKLGARMAMQSAFGRHGHGQLEKDMSYEAQLTKQEEGLLEHGKLKSAMMKPGHDEDFMAMEMEERKTGGDKERPARHHLHKDKHERQRGDAAEIAKLGAMMIAGRMFLDKETVKSKIGARPRSMNDIERDDEATMAPGTENPWEEDFVPEDDTDPAAKEILRLNRKAAQKHGKGLLQPKGKRRDVSSLERESEASYMADEGRRVESDDGTDLDDDDDDMDPAAKEILRLSQRAADKKAKSRMPRLKVGKRRDLTEMVKDEEAEESLAVGIEGGADETEDSSGDDDMDPAAKEIIRLNQKAADKKAKSRIPFLKVGKRRDLSEMVKDEEAESNLATATAGSPTDDEGAIPYTWHSSFKPSGDGRFHEYHHHDLTQAEIQEQIIHQEEDLLTTGKLTSAMIAAGHDDDFMQMEMEERKEVGTKERPRRHNLKQQRRSHHKHHVSPAVQQAANEGDARAKISRFVIKKHTLKREAEERQAYATIGKYAHKKVERRDNRENEKKEEAKKTIGRFVSKKLRGRSNKDEPQNYVYERDGGSEHAGADESAVQTGNGRRLLDGADFSGRNVWKKLAHAEHASERLRDVLLDEEMTEQWAWGAAEDADKLAAEAALLKRELDELKHEIGLSSVDRASQDHLSFADQLAETAGDLANEVTSMVGEVAPAVGLRRSQMIAMEKEEYDDVDWKWDEPPMGPKPGASSWRQVRARKGLAQALAAGAFAAGANKSASQRVLASRLFGSLGPVVEEESRQHSLAEMAASGRMSVAAAIQARRKSLDSQTATSTESHRAIAEESGMPVDTTPDDADASQTLAKRASAGAVAVLSLWAKIRRRKDSEGEYDLEAQQDLSADAQNKTGAYTDMVQLSKEVEEHRQQQAEEAEAERERRRKQTMADVVFEAAGIDADEMTPADYAARWASRLQGRNVDEPIEEDFFDGDEDEDGPSARRKASKRLSAAVSAVRKASTKPTRRRGSPTPSVDARSADVPTAASRIDRIGSAGDLSDLDSLRVTEGSMRGVGEDSMQGVVEDPLPASVGPPLQRKSINSPPPRLSSTSQMPIILNGAPVGAPAQRRRSRMSVRRASTAPKSAAPSAAEVGGAQVGWQRRISLDERLNMRSGSTVALSDVKVTTAGATWTKPHQPERRMTVEERLNMRNSTTAVAVTSNAIPAKGRTKKLSAKEQRALAARKAAALARTEAGETEEGESDSASVASSAQHAAHAPAAVPERDPMPAPTPVPVPRSRRMSLDERLQAGVVRTRPAGTPTQKHVSANDKLSAMAAEMVLPEAEEDGLANDGEDIEGLSPDLQDEATFFMEQR